MNGTESIETAGDLANAAVSGVETISKSISNYGPLVVLLSIFFVIFIILIVYMIISNHRAIEILKENNEKMSEQSNDINKKLVNTVIEAVQDRLQLDHKDSKETEDDYHKDLFGAYVNVSMALKDVSRTTIEKLKCNRIGIYVFHNGNKSFLGLPFFKMSCIHEWTITGMGTLRGKSHQALPLQLFDGFLDKLWENGYCCSNNVEKDALENDSIKEFANGSDTKALFIDAIKNSTGVIIGFAVAEFNKVDTFENDEQRRDQIKGIMDNMIVTISPIVASRYKFEPKDEE